MPVTFAWMHWTDGTTVAFTVSRGKLIGCPGHRSINLGAKTTVDVADVQVCLIPRTHGFANYRPINTQPFGGLTKTLAEQYQTAEYPAVDWSK